MHAVIWNTLLSGFHLNSFYIGKKKRERGGSREEEKEGERRGKEREREMERKRDPEIISKQEEASTLQARGMQELRSTYALHHIYRMARRCKLVTSI